jgi:Ankyrin repeats (3 copies)
MEVDDMSPDVARAFSVSLFQALDALKHAEAYLHSTHIADSPLTTTLLRASQVACSSCESALTRVEPFYTVTAFYEISESMSCRKFVSHVLANAETVVAALEYASERDTIAHLPPSQVCSDDAMRAAIDAGDLGAICLAVVVLLESSTVIAPSSFQCVHYAIQHVQNMFCTQRIIRLILSVPAIAASASGVDDNEKTALMLASQAGCTETVSAMLACPTIAASAGDATSTGVTALMLASRTGCMETVSAMLACPQVVATAGLSNNSGNTALMFASNNGFKHAVTALLACPTVVQSAGAANSFGNTALMLASYLGYKLIVTALLTCPTVVQSAGAANSFGNTALMIASHNGHTENVTALLACPTVVQSAGAANSDGDTALILGTRRKHADTVAALLKFLQ